MLFLSLEVPFSNSMPLSLQELEVSSILRFLEGTSMAYPLEQLSRYSRERLVIKQRQERNLKKEDFSLLRVVTSSELLVALAVTG